MSDWGGLGEIYMCDVTGLQLNTLENIDSLTGTHLTYMSDKNVYALRIADQKTVYMPNGVGIFFPNILSLQVLQSNLKFLSIENFSGLEKIKDANFWSNSLENIEENTFHSMKSLEGIYLSQNSIEIVHSGTFRNLKSLKIIELQNNKIKYLPIGLFQENANLEKIVLFNNAINSIPFGLFSHLTNLKALDLINNKCINQEANGEAAVNELITLSFECDVLYKKQSQTNYANFLQCRENLSNITQIYQQNITKLENDLIDSMNVTSMKYVIDHILFRAFFGNW